MLFSIKARRSWPLTSQGSCRDQPARMFAVCPNVTTEHVQTLLHDEPIYGCGQGFAVT